MYTKFWIPGTDSELDDLFEILRLKHYNDDSHRLHNNYAREAFKEVSVLSITFENNEPVMVSSILNRDCWPDRAYRICNRTWKVKEHRLEQASVLGPSPMFAEMVLSHVEYVQQNLDYSILFISRQTSNWQRFGARSFSKYGLDFKYDEYKYLTCSNENDDSCWQYIMYIGDDNVLTDWKRKPT
jgi:hypothetical protein